MKKLVFIFVSILTYISNTYANGYGLGGELSAGRTTLPGFFGTVHSNPAELPLQQNAKPLDKRLQAYYREKDIEIDQSNSFGMQLFNFNIAYEIGDADKLKDNWDAVGDAPEDVAGINPYVDSLNEFMSKTDDSIYFSLSANLDVLSPFVVHVADDTRMSFGLTNKFNGSMTLVGDADASFAIIPTNFADLVLKQQASELENKETTYIEENPEAVLDILQIRTAFYVKSSIENKVHLGYSTVFEESESGQLHIGARLNFFQLYLAKSLFPIKKYISMSVDNDEDSDPSEEFIDDFIELKDVYNVNYLFGLDIGMMWLSKNYSFGLTMLNVNEPVANFPSMGVNCNQYSDPGDVIDCYEAQAMSGAISNNETHTYEIQPVVSAAFFSDDKHLIFAFSQDLKEGYTPLNEAYQWTTIVLSYSPRVNRDSWYDYLLPDFRIGMNSNVSQSIDYYSLGLGWYGLNMDFMLDTTKFRGGGFSLSYGINF
jgi:hypothetical protein